MPCRDSGFLHSTRNLTGTSGSVYERQPAREGQPQALFENSKTLASSHLGNASRIIPRLHGISQLVSQLQDWCMCKNSESSNHYALDHRSLGSKVN